MCSRLSELREAMSAFAAAFDSLEVSGADAAVAVREAAAIEAMAGTVKGLAAARMADTGAWKHSGERSAAHHLAKVTGTSVGKAVEAIDTARRLDVLPEAAAAARRGELSADQAALIADAAAVDPAAEHQLVETGRRLSLAELREECARRKAAADPDPEARRARIRQARFLRSYSDSEGGWNLRMRDNPEVGAEIMAAITPITDRLFHQARRQGRREPTEAYAADALLELARGATASQPGRRGSDVFKVIARVDVPTLLRGYPIDGEVSEIVGYGPVAVSAIRDMIESGDPFLAAVITDGERVLGVAHLGRKARAKQRTALEWLYPACAAEGCPRQARLQIDHRDDWADTHKTTFGLLDRLCDHDHDLKTHHGWALIDGHGKRPFVPPEDPRHPRHKHPSPKQATGPPPTAA